MNSIESLTEVLFCTLTRPNGTNPKRLIGEVRKFGSLLSRVTKAHLVTECAGDTGENLHFHVIVRCLNSDLAQFKRRISRFQPEKANQWDLDFQEWCPLKGDGAWRYLADHPDSQRFKYCPRCKSSCRRSPVCEIVSGY